MITQTSTNKYSDVGVGEASVSEDSRREEAEFEIDSDTDPDFGILYRVWKGRQLLGTFYENDQSKWVAQPCNSDERYALNTAAQAELIILAVSGNLIADSAA